MDELKLKKNEAGETLLVITTETTQDVPFGAEELKRQISQHAEVINNLQKQLEAVQGYETSEVTDETIVPVVESAKPLIDVVELDKVVKEAVKEQPIEITKEK